MEPVTVDKAELLNIITANRNRHREVFEAALTGYRQYAQDQLEEHLLDLSAGKTPKIQINIARPVDHTRDYDRVIDMLKMHKGDEFTLNEADFAQYVHDDWSWKRQWTVSNSGYSVEVGKRYSDYLEE